VTFTPEQPRNPIGLTPTFTPPTAGAPTLTGATLPPPNGAPAVGAPTTLDDKVILNLPRARQAFINKYNDPQYKQLPQEIFGALTRFDAERVARGQNPLSDTQTTGVLRTLLTGEAGTQSRDKGGVKGFIGDTLRNVEEMARGVIRLPAALVDEAQQIPNLPANVSGALAKSTNPIDALSNLAEVPVLRFLPGAFIAENIDTPGELLDNPLFTALDVLPFASRAAGATRTVKAAREAAEVGARVRPLPTLLMNRLDNGGQLVPSRIGTAVNSSAAILASTRPGQLASAAFGRQSRQMMRLANEATDRVKEQLKGQGLSTQSVDDFAREAYNFNTAFDDIDAQTRVRLGEIATEDPARIADLPDRHRAYIEGYRRVQDDFAVKVGIESGELLAATIDGRTHVFDKATGRRLLKAQTQVDDIARIKAWRDILLDETIPPTAIMDELESTRNTVDSSGKSVAKIRDDLLLTRLEVAGFDVTAAREAAKNFQPITRDMITPRSTVFDDALDTLKKNRSDKVVAQLTAAITRGDFPTAVSKANSATVRNILGESADPFIADLKARRTQSRLANQYSRYNERVLTRATRQVDRVESRSVPATYQPYVTKQAREELAKRVEEVAIADPNLPQFIEAARRLDIGAIPYLTQWDLRAVQRDVALTWRQMAKELGPDHQPLFIHKVSPQKASKVTNPQIIPGAPAITQTRARSFDATPYVRDMSIAMDHQALEWLQKRAASEFQDTVAQTWGRSVEEIGTRYRDKAVRNAQLRAQRTGVTDYNTLVTDELNRLISRDYAPFGHQKLPSQALDTDLFIPKYLSDNIKRLAPSSNRILSDVVDPAMGVFRTSVLALSPRWHVYNLLGGAMMMALESPMAFRHMGRAWNMVKEANDTGARMVDPRTGMQVPPGAVQGGFVSVPEDMVRWTRDAQPGQKVAALFDFKGGQTARRLFEQARESRLAKAGSNVVAKSYSWNGMVDDMYRTMAYLEGSDSAIRRGLSPTQAAEQGVSLARKILANWDEMTPIERSVMRYWFPFYGFNSFLLRYVSKFPVDHPVRASIISSIARNELDDHSSSLPLDFLSMFQIGSPDAEGNVKSLNLRAVNPFSDVGDWFKTLGFMVGEGDLSALTGNTNPALSLVLQSIGVDTRTASSELFPDVKVDPQTGQLVADTSGAGLIPNAITSFVPQTRVLTSVLGFNSEFEAILRNNPDAAGRYLVSSLGLPVMVRDINIPEEQIKGETARQEEQSRARSEALRSGNFGLLREYPDLREYADVIEELYEQGLLDEYRPAASTSSTNPFNVLMGGLG